MFLVAREIVAEPVGVPEDRREQVVEVVGDAAGELPDRFHLLALTEPRFEIAPLGDVAGDRDEPAQVVVIVFERPDQCGADEPRAIPPPAHAFALVGAAIVRAREHRRELAVGHVEERRRRLVGHLVTGVPEHVVGADMPGDDAAMFVEHEHRVVLDAVEHQTHLRFGLAQTAIGRAPFPFARLGDQVAVVERHGGVAAELREQAQVVVREQRPATLDDEHDAPGMDARRHGRREYSRPVRTDLGGDFRLARRREVRDRRHRPADAAEHATARPNVQPDQRRARWRRGR